MSLVSYIDKRSIMLDIQDTGKEQIIEKMVLKLDECNLLLNREEALLSIMAREQLMSTGVGNGIAIPHSRTDAVKDIILTVATIRNGVNYKAVDKKKVFVIFMLIAPKNAASENLKVLTSIARILRDNQYFVEKLISAETAEDVIDLISKEENKL